MALNFDEFQKVVESAQQADAIKADLKRALKKVASAVETLQGALSEMETFLSDGYVATPKERKPRQARTPKVGVANDTTTSAPKKPGRPKKTAE